MPRKKKAVRDGWDEVSPEDLVSFADFLDREPLCETSMSGAMVDGLLTALVIGPELVLPSDYMPWIWDYENGKADPGFVDQAEVDQVFRWIQGMNNRIAVGLEGDPPVVLPVFIYDAGWDHVEWLSGFDIGTSFDGDVWRHAAKENPALFEPLDKLLHAKRDSTEWGEASEALAASVVKIRDYFRAGTWREAFEEVPAPFVRQGPKIGRNDPCPCGSGRKYKKCCGDAGAVVH